MTTNLQAGGRCYIVTNLQHRTHGLFYLQDLLTMFIVLFFGSSTGGTYLRVMINASLIQFRAPPKGTDGCQRWGELEEKFAKLWRTVVRNKGGGRRGEEHIKGRRQRPTGGKVSMGEGGEAGSFDDTGVAGYSRGRRGGRGYRGDLCAPLLCAGRLHRGSKKGDIDCLP